MGMPLFAYNLTVSSRANVSEGHSWSRPFFRSPGVVKADNAGADPAVVSVMTSGKTKSEGLQFLEDRRSSWRASAKISCMLEGDLEFSPTTILSKESVTRR